MKKTITITTYNYRSNPPKPDGTRQEVWELLPKLYCPNCGKQEVWHDTGPGDYYADENYMCRSCGASFYLPGGIQEQSCDPKDSDFQIWQQLK